MDLGERHLFTQNTPLGVAVGGRGKGTLDDGSELPQAAKMVGNGVVTQLIPAISGTTSWYHLDAHQLHSLFETLQQNCFEKFSSFPKGLFSEGCLFVSFPEVCSEQQTFSTCCILLLVFQLFVVCFQLLVVHCLCSFFCCHFSQARGRVH